MSQIFGRAPTSRRNANVDSTTTDRLNQSTFIVRRGTAITLTTTADTNMPLNTLLADTREEVGVSDVIIPVPRSGWYRIDGRIEITTAGTGAVSYGAYSDGAFVAGKPFVMINTVNTANAFSIVAELAVGTNISLVASDGAANTVVSAELAVQFIGNA